MKKLIATLLVIALAAPAFAASVDLTDNADGTGTVILTVEEGEVVRGVAVEVTADTDIIGVTGTDAIFNVFMDQAYTDAGAYLLEDDPAKTEAGSPVATPGAAGVLTLPASAISLSMGVLDETGAQGGAAAGTYTLGIIDLGGAGTVTLAADTTRGGVVGDGLDTEVTYTGGDITGDGGDPECWSYSCFSQGDANGDGAITSTDVQILVEAWGGYDACADFNKDGAVTSTDVQILVGNWGQPCE